MASARLCGTRSPAARRVPRAREFETTSPSWLRGRMRSCAGCSAAVRVSDYKSQQAVRWGGP